MFLHSYITNKGETISDFVSQWSAQPKPVKFCFSIYMLGFLVGTTTHLLNIIENGVFPDASLPLGFHVYWTSLTLFDPLTIIFLLYVPHWGMILAILIMASDIPINLYVLYVLRESDIFSNWGVPCQIIFGLFLFVSVPLVRKQVVRR